MATTGLIIHHAIKHYQERPDEIAFYEESQAITYANFYYLCANTYDLLKKAGVKEGSRIAFWSLNSLEWFAMYMASSALGAVCVPINTRSTPIEIAETMSKANVNFLFAQPSIGKVQLAELMTATDFLEAIFVVGHSREKGGTVNVIDLKRDFSPAEIHDVSTFPDCLNILFATSGTTSGSKLVAHTQQTINTHCQSISQSYGLDASGVVLLAALPFNGVFGFNALLASFCGAKPIVIMPLFEAQEAVRLIRRYAVTHTFGSDEMYRRMLAYIDEPLSSPRVFGFAAFSPDVETLAKQASEKGMPLFGLYGSSEVQALFAVQSLDTSLPERWLGGGSVANPQTQLRVVDFDQRQPVELGQIGELEIKSTSNFVGYLDNSTATEQAITNDGYFKTGDFGYLTSTHSFVYLGRRGDAIRLGGYLVDPKEIEDRIKSLPSIQDVAVVGVSVGNQSLCVAFYVESQSIPHHAELIREHLKAHISPYKIPTHFYPIAALPLTQSANGGKVKRAELRDLAIQYGVQCA